METMKNTQDQFMELIANETGMQFDGNDNRLFFDDSDTRVFAECMSEKEYSKMEKDLAKKEIKGKGYTVSAWNDCSGYKYWSKNEGESNYIQVTAYITDFNVIDMKKLQDDMNKLESYFQKYDNTEEYFAKQYREAK